MRKKTIPQPVKLIIGPARRFSSVHKQIVPGLPLIVGYNEDCTHSFVQLWDENNTELWMQKIVHHRSR